MNVIPKNNAALVPCRCDHPLITSGTHDKRRMDFPFFPPGSARRIEEEGATGNCQRTEDVGCHFSRLVVAEVVDLRQQEPVAEADDAQANYDEESRGFRQRRVCWPPVTRCQVVHIISLKIEKVLRAKELNDEQVGASYDCVECSRPQPLVDHRSV